MRREHGFTLVELLVVIAIIAILAAIVVPRIADWISKGNVAKAVTEINNIETSLTKMLADAGTRDFRNFFVTFTADTAAHAIDMYTGSFYALLRQGKNAVPPIVVGASATFRADILQRLGTSYMDLGTDPFKSTYKFWGVPWNKSGDYRTSRGPIPFRSFRIPNFPGGGEQPDGSFVPYRYNADRKTDADRDIPGNPAADDGLGGFPAYGFPAPADLPFYVWSIGEDLQSNQLPPWGDADTPPDHQGGGDDINNWDNQSGWSSFYN